MKKSIILTICVLFLQILASCHSNIEKTKEKNIYYKLYSEKDSLIGFSLRKYEFNTDTIREKYLKIDLDGKKTFDYKRSFYKKGIDLFIFSNIKNDYSKSLYFSPTKTDTCFHVHNRLENFYLCNKGKTNFKDYKNIYKVYYEENGYDSRKETLLLDVDYTILARFEDCYDYRKEVITDSIDINQNLKFKFKKAKESVLWW
ncbi:hypothetical protein [Flavobacterium cerinum]|uniref:Lipoprotein n=1 Tax=Flavobacterium cerinum TaxID=2502784 RepID=A0ABY5ISF0_9FLAO|nr:hypothetical protein [Flavobacterium cerinum]UUC45200.1 hypothetical protein NOX80_16440 [Flavobacterium cerinum]